MKRMQGGHRLDFIDGLRALAVLAVVVYHLSPATLPGGFSGVDVFLVISGFVVSKSITGHGYHKGWILAFFARRIRRLLPALAVCLLVTTLACALWVPEAWLSDRNPKTARMAFFGLSNWLLAKRGDDYFSPSIEFNPFAHTWSLGLEEQFYLLFPLLVFGWVQRRPGATISNLIVGGCALASAGYAASLDEESFRFAFLLLPARAWEFLVGALVWRFSSSSATMPGRRCVRAIVALLGLTTVVTAFFVASAASFPVPGAVPSVVGTSMVLFALRSHGDSALRRYLSWTPLRLVGRMSYSLYLWHWPVFSLFRWTVGLDEAGYRIGAVGLAILLGALSWRFVEAAPVRAAQRWSERRVVIAGLSCMAVSACVADMIHRQSRRWSQSVVMQNTNDWYPKLKAQGSGACGALQTESQSVGPGWVKVITTNDCVERPSGSRLFVIGDSHALALGPMFAIYAERTGGSVNLYNNGGCPVVSLQPEREASAHCRASIGAVLDHLLPQLAAGDVVVMPSLRMARRVDQWGGGVFVEELIPRGAEDARRLLRRIRSSGAKVVLFAPNLVLYSPLFRCADAWTVHQAVCRGGDSVDLAEFEERRRPMLDSLTALAAADDGIVVFDPVPVLCEAGSRCRGYRWNRPLFFDADHLSGFGARHLARPFIDLVGSGLRNGISQGGVDPGG